MKKQYLSSQVLKRASFLAIAIGIAQTGTANAQGNEQAEEGAQSPTIVVTATRRQTTLQETPLSVSSLSGEALERAGISDVADAVQFVPGVAVSVAQPGATDVIIRGVGTSTSQQSLNGAITNALTSAYLDQIPISSTVRKTPDFRFIDLERVEVLRGPQGTLYGQSAMGGVIRYIPSAPDPNTFGASLHATISDTDKASGANYSIDGHLNVPLSDTLALRTVFYNYENQGFIDVVGTASVQNANDEHTWGGRAALLWTPSDRFSLKVTGLYNNIELGNTQLISSTYPVDLNVFDPDPVTPVSTDRLVVQHLQPFEEEAWAIGVEMAIEFDPATVELILAHKETETETQFESAEFVGLQDTFFGGFNPTDGDTDSIELRVSSNGEGRLIDWLVGAYYEDNGGLLARQSVASGDAFLLSLFGVAPGDVFDSGRQVSYEDLSFFGEITVNPTENFALTGGYRHARTKNNYEVIYDFFNGFDLSTVDPNTLVGKSQLTKENVDTYRFNASLQASDSILLYTNIASGYRPGGFNPGDSTFNIPDSSYVSDSLWTYEIGIRTGWWDDRLLFNLAAYHTDWSDIQLATFDPATLFTATQNVGKAEIDGVEIELMARPSRFLTLSGSYAYTDARIVENSPATGAMKGDQLPATPKSAFSTIANLNFPFGNGHEINLTGSYRHVGKRAGGLGATSIEMPSYDLLDLRAGVSFDNGITVEVFADNITNEIPVFQSFATGLAGFNYNMIGRPQTFGISLRFER